MRTRIRHSDWKPRWLIRCVSAALLSFMDKQEAIKRTMAREYDRELVCRERRGVGAVVRRMAAAANECAGTDRAKDSGVRSGAPMPARKEPAPG